MGVDVLSLNVGPSNRPSRTRTRISLLRSNGAHKEYHVRAAPHALVGQGGSASQAAAASPWCAKHKAEAASGSILTLQINEGFNTCYGGTQSCR